MTIHVPDDTPFGMGNCGIVAVAMLADTTHATALEAVNKGRKRGLGSNTRYGTAQHQKDFGKGWEGWTTHELRAFALLDLGFEVVDVFRGRQTLQNFARGLNPSDKVMVRITKHVVTIWGGLVFDQHHRKGIPVADYGRARAFVTHAHVARKVAA
jgi:hypothetical protein